MRRRNRTALAGDRPPIIRRTSGHEGPVGMWHDSASGSLHGAPQIAIVLEEAFHAVPDNQGQLLPSSQCRSRPLADCGGAPVAGIARSARAAAPGTVRVAGLWD